MSSKWHLFICVCVHVFTDGSTELFEDLKGKAFVSIWNAPSNLCERKFGIKFDLSQFDIIANSNGAFIGDEMVIFYKAKIGLYPYLLSDGTPVNGGLPQNGDFSEHLKKVEADVRWFIPDPNFSGLAVIDWEEWRPIFERNMYNSKMKKYVIASEELVRNKHPDWSRDQITAEAKAEFEAAARKYMQKTLELCRRLRPNGYWGFYGFPNCFNYREGEKTCDNDTEQMNDRLSWLFASSTVLLPSIYLSEAISPAQDRYWFVYGQLKEAVRLAHVFGQRATPIVPYTRFRYRDTGNFYSRTDLVSTVQQSAEAGLNGVALWDSTASFESPDSCQAISTYVNTTLGPFIKNQTTFMNACSRKVCNSHGHCMKRDWAVRHWSLKSRWSLLRDFQDFLKYLLRKWPIAFYFVIGDNKPIGFQTAPGPEMYKCRCFDGWFGVHCEKNYKY